VINTAIKRAEGAIKRFLRYDPVRSSKTEFYPQTDVVQDGHYVWEVNDSVAYQRSLTQGRSDRLLLKRIPVRSITELRVDYDGRFGTQSGSFGADSLKTEGEDYWANFDGVDSDGNGFCSDGMVRSVGMWPTTPGSVKITYTAGYSADELHGQDSVLDASPIAEAALIETVRRVRRMFGVNAKNSQLGFVPGTIESEKLGDYSYKLGSGGSSAAGSLKAGASEVTSESMALLEQFVHWGCMT